MPQGRTHKNSIPQSYGKRLPINSTYYSVSLFREHTWVIPYNTIL
jgi:hypothetical protein